MELLASLLVGKPQNILAVAAVLFAGFLVLQSKRFGAARHPRPLLFASIAWLVYAAWEWLVLIKTPEANIRVDILVIWPVLAILSAWGLFRAFR